MKIGIVTTFSDHGYEQYGKNFIQSCKKFLDKDITLYLYIDNANIEQQENIIIKNLESSIPELTNFKKRNSNKKPETFLQDAVRFSHKSYCIYHASKNTNVDLLFWLDSDTEIIDNLTVDFFKELIPLNYFSSYLGRSNYTETGFLGFNLNHKFSTEFFNLFKEFYDTDNIYNLEGQLDCHVYDAARLKLEVENKIQNLNLSPSNIEKNHFNVVFEGKMIHYKGNRKNNKEAQLAKSLRRKNGKS
jgi:hypothetical protein